MTKQHLLRRWWLIVLLSMYSGVVGAAQPTELLVTPAMFVRELPPLLSADSVPTLAGDLRYIIQPETRTLIYQLDENELHEIALPEDAPAPDYHTLTLLDDDTRAELCLADETQSMLVLLDFAAQQARAVGECPPTRLSNAPVYPVTQSPDQRLVRVSADAGDGQACPQDALRWYPLRLEYAGSMRVVGCVRMEGIAFDRWLDNDHVLIRTYHPTDALPPLEEWWVLDAVTGQLTSLGIQMQGLGTHGMSFASGSFKVVRLSVLDAPKNEVVFEPQQCQLTETDLLTLISRPLDDPTLCPYTPDVWFSLYGDSLFYVHYAAEQRYQPRATLRRIELLTDDVRVFSVSGKILQLVSLAPDEGRVVLLVDDAAATWDSGRLAEGMTRAHAPRWVMYDLLGDRIVYEKALFAPLPENGVDLRSALARGALGFRWRADGWETLFLDDAAEAPALFIQTKIRRTRAVPLDALLPLQAHYTAVWSPDSRRLLITAGTPDDVQASYIFNTVDETLTPITQAHADDFTLQITWDRDNRLILTMRAVDNPLVTRWLIQPDPQFWT